MDINSFLLGISITYLILFFIALVLWIVEAVFEKKYPDMKSDAGEQTAPKESKKSEPVAEASVKSNTAPV